MILVCLRSCLLLQLLDVLAVICSWHFSASQSKTQAKQLWTRTRTLVAHCSWLMVMVMVHGSRLVERGAIVRALEGGDSAAVTRVLVSGVNAAAAVLVRSCSCSCFLLSARVHTLTHSYRPRA